MGSGCRDVLPSLSNVTRKFSKQECFSIEKPEALIAKRIEDHEEKGIVGLDHLRTRISIENTRYTIREKELGLLDY